MVKYFCDRCHVEVADKMRLSLVTIPTATKASGSADVYAVCAGCLEQIRIFVAQPTGGERARASVR